MQQRKQKHRILRAIWEKKNPDNKRERDRRYYARHREEKKADSANRYQQLRRQRGIGIKRDILQSIQRVPIQ